MIFLFTYMTIYSCEIYLHLRILKGYSYFLITQYKLLRLREHNGTYNHNSRKGTHREIFSESCWINREMVITMQICFDSTKFRKDSQIDHREIFSESCWINWKRVITMQICFGSTKLRKDSPVMYKQVAFDPKPNIANC